MTLGARDPGPPTLRAPGPPQERSCFENYESKFGRITTSTCIIVSESNNLMLYFRRLRQVKVTRVYVIISIYYCSLTDMMVMPISHMGQGPPPERVPLGPP